MVREGGHVNAPTLAFVWHRSDTANVLSGGELLEQKERAERAVALDDGQTK
jgi:hypothetical protein